MAERKDLIEWDSKERHDLEEAKDLGSRRKTSKAMSSGAHPGRQMN